MQTCKSLLAGDVNFKKSSIWPLLGAREVVIVAVNALFVLISLLTPIIVVVAIALVVGWDEACNILVCKKLSIYTDGVANAN
jgi:hypothetical protein